MTPFDLGDIANVKVGDFVAIITREGEIKPHIFVVAGVTDWRVLVRRPGETKTAGAWLVKNGGGCPLAMHDQSVMRYYYTANPEHIARARERIIEVRAAEEKRKADHAAKMKLYRPVGLELGDGWNEEDDCRYEPAAQTLAERLTEEQLRTLAGWLGVELPKDER